MLNKIKVEFCMGSSCFSKGNSTSLRELKAYIEKNELTDRVEIEGHLCSNRCNSGPHIFINDEKHSNISSEELIRIIHSLL